MTKISEFLQKHKALKKVSNYRLAKDSGVPETSVGPIMKGEREPGAETLIKLVVALGVEKEAIAELF